MSRVKKVGPYVGVTGFTCLNHVIACNNTFMHAKTSFGEGVDDLKLMVGVLVSSKTLAGEIGGNFFNRYPSVASIPEIISCTSNDLLYTIHYNTSDSSTIDEQIDAVMGISPNIDAIQLNIRWTNSVLLQKVRRKYPNLRIILQIGAGALAIVQEKDDIYLGDALCSYEGVVDDFLVDPSGGGGKDLDVWKVFACVADEDIPPSMQPGVAGGRSAENVQELNGLMRRLKRPVNVDAEGKLHFAGPGGGCFNVDRANMYILKAVPILGSAMKKYSRE